MKIEMELSQCDYIKIKNMTINKIKKDLKEILIKDFTQLHKKYEKTIENIEKKFNDEEFSTKMMHNIFNKLRTDIQQLVREEVKIQSK